MAKFSICQLNHSIRRRLLRWAVLEHESTFRRVDNYIACRLESEGNKFTAAIVKDIVKKYEIKRFRGHEEMADLLNECLPTWPDEMDGRAAKCSEITQEHAERASTNRFFSGVTKFMWFYSPRNWSMFDSRAATALGIHSDDTRIRMKRFYDELIERRFVEHASRINEDLEGTGYEFLYGERIIDKFLWICGNPMVAAFAQLSRVRNTPSRLALVADSIARKHADTLLQP